MKISRITFEVLLIIAYWLTICSSIASKLSFMHSRALLYARQMLNLPAIENLGRIYREPYLLIPDISINHLKELNIDDLLARRIKFVVFDKDNTLSYTYDSKLHPSVIEPMERFRSAFGNNIAILSNSVGSVDDIEYKDAVETEKNMNIPVIRHRHKKPKCIDEVLAHFQSSAGDGGGHSIRPEEICMIGDRVLTDVVFGNMHGMHSILVKPLSLREDHVISIIFRFIERKLILSLLRFLGYKQKSRI